MSSDVETTTLGVCHYPKEYRDTPILLKFGNEHIQASTFLDRGKFGSEIDEELVAFKYFDPSNKSVKYGEFFNSLTTQINIIDNVTNFVTATSSNGILDKTSDHISSRFSSVEFGFKKVCIPLKQVV